jgi:cytochrome c oxidase subunit 2
MTAGAGAAHADDLGRRSFCAAIVLILLAGLSGCSARIGVPEPGSEQAENVLSLWRVLFWSAVVVGTLVLGLLSWCLIRYRRRRGDDDDLPVQTAGNIPLELFYTAIPFILAGVLFWVAVGTEIGTARGSSTPDLRVDVTGFQWQWRFHYPEEAVTVLGVEDRTPELVLPVDRTVRFRLMAADVIHSFFVPAFLVKRDLIPGHDNELSIRPNRLGTFRANCAEFCGLSHDRMGFDVRVVTAAEYEQWLAVRRVEAAATGGGATAS